MFIVPFHAFFDEMATVFPSQYVTRRAVDTFFGSWAGASPASFVTRNRRNNAFATIQNKAFWARGTIVVGDSDASSA